MRPRISREKPAVVLTVALGMFLAAYVVISLNSGLSIYPDSARYLDQSLSDLLDPRQPGPLTGLAYMIVGSQGVVPLQFVLGCSAGVAFLYAVYRLIGKWAGLTLATVAGVFLLLPEFHNWHAVALTESLSLSLMLAWLAVVLLLLSAPKHTLVAPLVASATVLLLVIAISKPWLLLAVAPAQIALLITRRGDLSSGRKWIAWGGLVVAAGFFTVRLIQSQSLTVWTAAYVENNLVTKPGFRAYAAPELNSCPDLLAAASSHESMSAFRGLVPGQCPDAWDWMLSFAGSPLGWLLSDPFSFIKNFAWDMWWLRLPNYGAVADAQSEVVGPLLVSVLLAVVGAVCGLCFPSSVKDHPETAAQTALVLSGVLAGFFVYGVAMWASDGMEVARHMMPVTLLTPLVMMVLVAFFAARAKLTTRLEARTLRAQ